MAHLPRNEHLEWAKKRALEYWEAGDYPQAVTSMMSDLSKHPELQDHAGLQIGAMWFLATPLHHDGHFVHRFITGFN